MPTITHLILLLIVAAVAKPVALVPALPTYVYRTDFVQPTLDLDLESHASGSYYAPIPIQTLDFGARPLPQIAKHAQFIEADYLEDVDREKHDLHDENDEEGHNLKREERLAKGYKSKEDGSDDRSKKEEYSYNETINVGGEGTRAKLNHDEDEEGQKKTSVKKRKGKKHGNKKHHGESDEVSGYQKSYHKDEYKEDHDTYDVSDKSGNFTKYGKKKGKSKNKQGGQKKAGHYSSHNDAGQEESVAEKVFDYQVHGKNSNNELINDFIIHGDVTNESTEDRRQSSDDERDDDFEDENEETDDDYRK